MIKVIALTGLAGSGKSTVAGLLSARYGYKNIKFADPLKQMLRVIGLGNAELEGEKKGLPSKLLCGRSPRYAMQTLGTDWGRALISDDIWATIWKAKIKEMLADGVPGITCDDCRFENEVSAVRNFGGVIWNVRRPGSARLGATGGLPGHASEAGIAARYATVQINNSGTKEDLMEKISSLMSDQP